MRIPAALAAIPFLIGSATGVLVFDSAGDGLALYAAASGVLALLAALAWAADTAGWEVAAAVVAGCLVAGLSLGLTAARNAYHPTLLTWFDAAEPEGPVILEGVVREDAAPTAFGASFVLDVTGVAGRGADVSPLRVRGSVRLSVGGASAAATAGQWRAGRRISAPVILRRPTTYRNPGAPDEQRALARRGIVLLGSTKSAALVEVVASGSTVAEAAAAARAWARTQLGRHVGRRSGRSGGIVTAILIGDRSALDDEDERRLQEAGTYHVIAISGGNIAILTVILVVVLRTACLPRRMAAAVTIAALLFYAQLTGAQPSVARAVTAAVIYLAGRMLDHRGPPLNLLAVAAVIAVAVSPLAALDPGFILSFGATLAILLGGSHVAMKQRRPSGPAGRLRLAAVRLLVATVCAELALAPVGASLFSRITIAGLVVNFVAIPLMTIAQLASLATLALSSLSSQAADACGAVAHLAATGLVESARIVDAAPWLVRDIVRPAWWVVTLHYAGCVALLYGRTRAGAACAGCSMSLMLVGPAAATRDALPPREGLLRVVFLDVGQGDATLVTLPDGRALLVDAGGMPGSPFDIGERVVGPALRVLGVRRLEELVITHGDPDHLGGALSIARRFMPRVFREGIAVPPHAGLRELAALAAASGAAWRTVQAGDLDRVAGVDIRILHPPLPDWERQRVRNDDSIVLELRFGDVSVLLPGDIGRGPELGLAPHLALAPLVVLKAPHHGSATSSTREFIEAVKPSVVVFSSGRRNRFGHPAPAVVARYRHAGATMFNTAWDGAVVIETDGTTIEITTPGGTRLLLPS